MVRAQSVYVQNGELMRMSSCKCLECLEGMYCPLKHTKTRPKHMLLLFSEAVAPLSNVKALHATEALNSMHRQSRPIYNTGDAPRHAHRLHPWAELVCLCATWVTVTEVTRTCNSDCCCFVGLFSLSLVERRTKNKEQRTKNKERSRHGGGDGPQGNWIHIYIYIHTLVRSVKRV